MPDLLVHVLVPWCALKLFQLRFGRPSNGVIALVLLGAVFPDLAALQYLGGRVWGYHVADLVLPLHTLVGAALVAGVGALWFTDSFRAWCWIMLGVCSHFALDSLLVHAAGGMVLLFPVVWVWDFQLGLLKSTDWALPVVTGGASFLIWIWTRRGCVSRKT